MRRFRSRVTAIVAAVALVVTILGFAAPAAAVDCGASCGGLGAWQEYPLFAGKTWQVGVVRVNNCDDKIIVEYKLFDAGVADNGWRLTELHLAVGDALGDIPQTKTGNPIPGEFSIVREYYPGVKSDTFCVERESGWTAGTTLYVAAHAVVNKPSTTHTETGSFCATSGVNTKLGDAVTPATLCWVHPGWNPNLRDAVTDADSDLHDYAQWVWDAYLNPTPRIGDKVELYHEFQIPDGATITSAQLQIAADNAFSWKLNAGAWTDVNLVGDWRNQTVFTTDYLPDPNITSWKKVYTYDVASQISPLANALYVTGVNAAWATDDPQYNPGGVLYKLCGAWSREVSDNNAANDTAWAGTTQFRGKNWATYFTYEIRQWELVDTVLVYPSGTNPYLGTPWPSHIALTDGVNYKLVASGLYRFAQRADDYGLADAQFNNRWPGAPPSGVAGWQEVPSNRLQVWIGGAMVDWQPPTYNPAHIYSLCLEGDGAPAVFTISDDQYQDNTGYITVQIYAWR